MKNILLLAAMLSLLISCDDDEDPKRNRDYIIFGHFYGECMGEGCVETYKLTDTELYEDKLGEYPLKDGTIAKTMDFELLDNSLFEKVKSLKSSVPDELIATTETIIGHPDGGDWGGIYFEMSVDGNVSYWFLDKHRGYLPDNLEPFVTEIENSIALINE